MSEHLCARCEETKPAEQMLQRRGKPASTCVDCFRAAMSRGARKGNGKAKRKANGAGQVKSLAEVVSRRAAKAPETPTQLVIAATYGCRVRRRDDGYFDVEQDAQAEDGAIVPAQLVLSRDDIRALADFAAR